jgi:hypothetical protein
VHLWRQLCRNQPEKKDALGWTLTYFIEVGHKKLKDDNKAAFDKGVVFYFAGNLELSDGNHVFRPAIAP